MKLVFLASRLTGYMAACLRALGQLDESEIVAVRHRPPHDAPHDEALFSGLSGSHWRDEVEAADMWKLISAFKPEAILMAGWNDRAYMSVARRCRNTGIPVVAGSDAQWRGTPRQRAACVAARPFLHRAIDVLWVSGSRQREFARRLGFGPQKCWDGMYSCDVALYRSAYERRAARQSSFLYVGRLMAHKGLGDLVRAYRAYRLSSDAPWPLICAGSGEMAPVLEREPGVECVGFLGPDDLANLMATSGAFVLPSRREPWGVVVHEAAAAGLPLLCSTACGAADHLLQEGKNGFLFDPADTNRLGTLLSRIAETSRDELGRMSDTSAHLALQFTPERWAKTLHEGVARLAPAP